MLPRPRGRDPFPFGFAFVAVLCQRAVSRFVFLVELMLQAQKLMIIFERIRAMRIYVEIQNGFLYRKVYRSYFSEKLAAIASVITARAIVVRA